MNFFYFSIIFLLTNICYAQENITAEDTKFCEGLVKYRDNQLLKDFTKVSNKYQINYQAKVDIANIKQILLDDNKWQMSNAGHAFAILLSSTKSACNVILDLLQVSKANKVVLESYDVYKLYTYGIKGQKFIESGFVQTAFDEGTEKVLGDLTPILSTATAMLNSMNEVNNLGNDWRSYRLTIRDQVKLLDNQIKLYDVSLKAYNEDFEKINKCKNYIDNYLKTNCTFNQNVEKGIICKP